MAIDTKLLEITPVSELTEVTGLQEGSLLFYDGSNKLKRISLETFNNLSKTAKPIGLSDVAPTVSGLYKPKTAGTYANAGGLVALEGYSTLFFFDGTNWTKTEEKFPQASPNLRLWSALPFSKDEQVVKDSVIYIALQNVLATDVPGVSAKWVALGGQLATDIQFKDKNDKKAMSPNHFFSVIGNVDFGSVSNEQAMQKPWWGWNMNSANGTASAGVWGWNPTAYENLVTITHAKVKYNTAGTKFARIYGRSNPAIFEDFSFEATEGINVFYFNPPLEADKVLIGFDGVGLAFRAVSPEVTPAGTLSTSGFSPNNAVSLGLELYTSDVTKLVTITDRLTKLEKNNSDWSNVLHDSTRVNVSLSNNASYLNGIITMNNDSNAVITQQVVLGDRYLEIKANFSINTVFWVGQYSIENAIGKGYAVVDCVTKKLKLYNLDDYSNVAVSGDIPFNIVNGREYIVRFYKKEPRMILEIIDGVTGEAFSCEYSPGGQWDAYQFGVATSTNPVTVSSVKIIALCKDQPFLMFEGDSITQGDIVGNLNPSGGHFYRKRFANLIANKMNKPFAVSSRSSGNINGVLARIDINTNHLKPKYYIVTVGTNNGNTLSKLNELADKVAAKGIELILNTIPLYDGQNTADKNAMILQVVNERGLKCIRMDIATSINGDGVTKDNTCFAPEGGAYIHPNEKGNYQIYRRALIDLEDLFIEAGV